MILQSFSGIINSISNMLWLFKIQVLIHNEACRSVELDAIQKQSHHYRIWSKLYVHHDSCYKSFMLVSLFTQYLKCYERDFLFNHSSQSTLDSVLLLSSSGHIEFMIPHSLCCFFLTVTLWTARPTLNKTAILPSYQATFFYLTESFVHLKGNHLWNHQWQ